MEEKRTKASRDGSSKRASRWSAPSVFAAVSRATSSSVQCSILVSEVSPAVCTTARTVSSPARSPSTTRVSSARSATSQARMVVRAPSADSSAPSSAAPGDCGPRRLSRTRCSAPSAASFRATWAPRPPVPPVMSTVPRGFHGSTAAPAGTGADAGARSRRRPKSPAARTATWSSPAGPASTAHSPSNGTSSSSAPGRSTNPPQRCGSSSAATRPSPQISACTGLTASGSYEAVVTPGVAHPGSTAPLVTHHSGACSSRSPSA